MEVTKEAIETRLQNAIAQKEQHLVAAHGYEGAIQAFRDILDLLNEPEADSEDGDT